MTSGGVVGWEKAEDVPCSSLSNYHFVPRDDYTRSLHTPEARGGVQWASIIIKGTSRLKMCEELGLESLKFRRWMRRLCVFYKIKTRGHPKYLYKLIPTKKLFL